ncbi:glycerol-1-phosphate dehydrogenase [Aeropyrum pernix]|uniref:Glycerol-1-phosphate dehydrogenase [NAD(P)+] n=1 Tax=Aeropyrum pernix TaxID=56636 RepID=A0A401H8L6_AERPX|nr:NAD(P)-dependent glycerol-1-phosphate dehydrogenase [Aeropyrum pernix]GBF08754.1 glycerol-1-phosphate dehydrogenase [Aeropyrum pernix]
MYTSFHRIDLPRTIVVGGGVLDKAGGYVAGVAQRGSYVLVVSGPTVSSKYFERLRASLEAEGLTVGLKIIRDATVETAEEVAREALESRIEVVAGLGGGKSIDVAKYASKRAGSVFVSIPTVASHDGITSPFSSLKGFDKPISRPAKAPEAIIIDVDVIAEAPRRYNIAGFGDLIGKYTAVLDWRLAHKLRLEYYGEYAASLALLSAKHVSQYAEEIALGTREGYRVLLEALVSSGVSMCIAGSTRPASGSEHLFAHALHIVARNKPLHGEAVGVGTIMMAYLHGKNWRRIRGLLKTVGAPTNAKELGVEDDEVVEALTIAARIRPERYTILGEKGLTREAAEALARKTGVI